MVERADVRRKSGDTGRPLVATLTAKGRAIDLSGALVVRLIVRRGGEHLLTGECEVADQAAFPGRVLYRWEPGDLDTPGLHLFEFEVRWSDMTVTTVPDEGYFRLLVSDDLDDPWADAPAWAPTVDAVARLVPAYTVGRFDDDTEGEEAAGDERGTFTDGTMPTAEHVRGLILDACEEVAGRVGVPIPAKYEKLARRCAAYLTAAMVSGGKLPADTEDARGEYQANARAFRAALDELALLCRKPLALRLV